MNNCNIAVSTKLTFISSETCVGASTKLFVFVDDERNPSNVDWFQSLLKNNHSAWLTHIQHRNDKELIVVIRTFFDFVYWIETQKTKSLFDWNNVIFSFDHDLQDWHQKPTKSEIEAQLGVTSETASPSLLVRYGINYPYGEHPNKIELTGASCLQYLLDNVENFNLDNIDLHTKNPIAINSMRNIANRYNFRS